ncbi:MAG TPA: GNAT family N-acetyltransferase [Phenylobacterium sp.]
MAQVRIRPAVAEDAESIARLHHAIWLETYRDIAPPQAVAALGLDERIGRWRRMLADDAPTFVAIAADQIVGFARCGAASDALFEGRGEVKFLFVAPEFGRQGLGRRLMARMADELQSRGYSGIGLGVVEANTPAVAFYKSLGGVAAARYLDPGPLWRSQNLLMVWDDLGPLLIA